MATPQDLQNLPFGDLARDMELLRGGVSGSTRNFSDLSASQTKYKQAMEQTIRGIEGSAKSLIKSLYEGQEGVSAYNDAVRQGTNVFIELIKEIPIVGKALAMLADNAREIALRALEDFDKVFDSYRDMSRAGATGAGGMMAFATQAERAGYLLKNLNEFTALVKQNSQTMALFGSTTMGGVEKIASISKQITDSGLRRELFAMGFKVNEINEGIVRYSRVLTITGQQNRMTQEQLYKGAVAYVKELDFLTKLTGKQADELQAEREAREQEERALAARIRSEAEEKRLRALGLKEQADFIKAQRESKQTLLSAIPKNLQADFSALFEGLLTGKTPELLQMMPELAGYVAQGGRDIKKFAEIGLKDLEKFTGPEGVGNFAAFVGQFGDSYKFAFSDIINLQERLAQIATKGAIDRAKSGQIVTDAATKAQAELREAQIQAATSLQRFIRDGVEAATKALIELRQKINDITGKGSTTGPSAGTPVSTVGESKQARESAEKSAQEAIAKAKETRNKEDRIAAAKAMREAEIARANEQSARIQAGRAATSMLPGRPAAPPTPPRPAAGGTPEDPLAGLNFGGRRGERTGGGEASANLISLARKVQEIYPDAVFTALNDVYHTIFHPNSKHTKGLAMDFALTGENIPRNREEAAMIKDQVKKLGASLVLDEYFSDRNKYTTGDHFHAEVSAQFGRLASGPLTGYRATLHGNEVVIPLSNGQNIPLDMSPLTRHFDQTMEAMKAQVDRLDNLIRISSDQLSVNRKMLSYRT